MRIRLLKLQELPCSRSVQASLHPAITSAGRTTVQLEQQRDRPRPRCSLPLDNKGYMGSQPLLHQPERTAMSLD